MKIDYNIVQRESNQHRAGHYCLLINDVDADITIDPAQFVPKALREAQAEGIKDPAALAVRQMEICQDYAKRAFERRIGRLRAGTMPQGINVDKSRGGKGSVSGGTAGDMAILRQKRGSEEKAVEAFLNRGRLRGMTKEERKARAAKLATKQDSDADWRERRAALIAQCEADLKEWKEKEAKGDPKAPRWVRIFTERLAGLQMPTVVAATHGFQYAYTQYLTGAIDLVNNDIRIWPLMTNTTLDTVRDAVDTFSDVTADEFDGSGYSAGGLALDSQAVAVDDANDRAEFDAADEDAGALGAGTRSIQGVALGKFNTNTAGSLPLHWLEFASNKTPDGSNFTFVFNSEGILQAADG